MSACVLCELFGDEQHAAGHPDAPRHGEKDYRALRPDHRTAARRRRARFRAALPKCSRKRAWDSPAAAEAVARRMENPALKAYHCHGCGRWHVGSSERLGA